MTQGLHRRGIKVSARVEVTGVADGSPVADRLAWCFEPRRGDVMAAGGYGYVIVGAGSAGCVLANRLSADPACQVALLEAGGPDRAREIRIPAALTKLFLTEYDWNYRTTKQPQLSDRELYWPAVKLLVVRHRRVGDAADHPRPYSRADRHDR
jgi:hypothetical protein